MNTTGYKFPNQINEKWLVAADENFSADWNTTIPLKLGALAKLGFTITQIAENEFELSYILRRDPIFEPFDTLESAMNRADEIAEGFKK